MPILLKAAEDKDTDLRANAVLALGTLGDRTIMPTLMSALSDGSSEVRANAVRALTTLGDRSAVPHLLKVLAPLEARELDYWEQEFKIAIIRALGELKDTSALSSLERALFNSDPEVSLAARRALNRFDSPEARQLLSGPT